MPETEERPIYWRIFCGDVEYLIIAKTKKDAIKLFEVSERGYKNNHTAKDITKIKKEWLPPLCGVRWLGKHKGEHSDFIPEIEIAFDGYSFRLKGNIKKGALKEIIRKD